MDEQSRMDIVPPAVKTAVATAVYCEAGRRLAHPVRTGWDRPCPWPGTETLVIHEEDGSRTALKLCLRHKWQLDLDGLTTGEPQ